MGARSKADQVKRDADRLKRFADKTPSREDLLAQIRKFYSSNSNKKSVVHHLLRVYEKRKFTEFGFGKFKAFIVRHDKDRKLF